MPVHCHEHHSGYRRVTFGQRMLAEDHDPGLDVVLRVTQGFEGRPVGFEGRIVWQTSMEGVGETTDLNADAQIGRPIEFGLDQLQQHFIQPRRRL